MNPAEVDAPQREAVNTANALIQHSLPFLQGVRRLANLRFQLPGEQGNSDFLFLAGVASEADHIPAEAIRSLCNSSWLARCDNEAKELEAHYGEHVLNACKSIIERYPGVA